MQFLNDYNMNTIIAIVCLLVFGIITINLSFYYRKTQRAKLGVSQLSWQDSITLDSRRKVVRFFSDDYEYLILTGGPNDLVIHIKPLKAKSPEISQRKTA